MIIVVHGIKITKIYVEDGDYTIFKYRYVDPTNLHFMELSHIPYYNTTLYDDTSKESVDLGGLSFEGFMDKVKQLKNLS